MRTVIADEWMTLDGVIQAPGQADEDTTGGFQHGGWHVGYFDDLAQSRSSCRRWSPTTWLTSSG
jgi:hypothetical protein